MEDMKEKFKKLSQYFWDPKFSRSVVILTSYEMNYSTDLFHWDLIGIY